jgi:hypothetical protein
MACLSVTAFSLTKNNALYLLRPKNKQFYRSLYLTPPLPSPQTQRKNRATLFLQPSNYQISSPKNTLITLVSTQPQNFIIIRARKKSVSKVLLVKNFSDLFRLSLCYPPINATRFLINNDVLI